MDQNEQPGLILRFQRAREKGTESLADPGKNHLRVSFLQQARLALSLLYGREAPIVQEYVTAIKNRQTLSQNEYLILLEQFVYHLKLIESISGQGTANTHSFSSIVPVGRRVFIIHGSDEINTLRLAGTASRSLSS
jgi:hypothetical protein